MNGSSTDPRSNLGPFCLNPTSRRIRSSALPDGLRSTSVLHAMRAGCGPRARSRPGAQPPSSASEQGGVEVTHDTRGGDADRRRRQQAGEVAEPAVAGEREERRRLVEAAEALVAVGELAAVLVCRTDEREEHEAPEERDVRRAAVREEMGQAE